MNLRIPVKGNNKLKKVLKKVHSDKELETFWQCANVTAIDRLGFNDHGPTHVKIVTNLALRILRLLTEAGVEPNVVKDHGMKNDDAELVVVLASILHDLGHVAHRKNHRDYSIPLSMRFMDKYLKNVYGLRKATIMKSEILHAIVSHGKDTPPLTLEAGVVQVADALDMEKGRARIPFNAGTVNIYSVSAMAIDKISIRKGKKKPVEVLIDMCNSAGIFQIDELLSDKVRGSGLENYLKVIVQVKPEGETKIIDKFEF